MAGLRAEGIQLSTHGLEIFSSEILGFWSSSFGVGEN